MFMTASLCEQRFRWKTVNSSGQNMDLNGQLLKFCLFVSVSINHLKSGCKD